jgi:hypothetical protein
MLQVSVIPEPNRFDTLILQIVLNPRNSAVVRISVHNLVIDRSSKAANQLGMSGGDVDLTWLGLFFKISQKLICPLLTANVGLREDSQDLFLPSLGMGQVKTLLKVVHIFYLFGVHLYPRDRV